MRVVRARSIAQHQAASALLVEHGVGVASQDLLWVCLDGPEVVAAAGLRMDGMSGFAAGGAFLSACAVHPAHRGRGLQRALIRARLRAAHRAGASVVTSYTATDNVASLVNLVREGFIPTEVDGDWISLRRDRRVARASRRRR